MRATWTLLLMTLLVCGAATPARADPTAHDRYGNVFNDELLAAGVGGPLAARVQVTEALAP